MSDTRGLSILDSVLQDLRYTFRTLLRDAGFTTFAVLIVGLGIGASATIFSVVNALLLRPLPFSEPERLVWITNHDTGGLSGQTTQVGHLLDLREHNRSFSDLAGYFAFYGVGDNLLSGRGEPERLSGVPVSENFFQLLGIQPQFGRLFTAAECKWNGPKAVLLSHGLWIRRFGSDPGVVGSTLTINEEPVTVAGILPASFDLASVFAPGNHFDLYFPFPLSNETNRWGNTMAIVARLKPGVAISSAQAELKVLAEQITRAHPERNDFEGRLTPLAEHVSGRIRPALLVLAFAVGVVMLIVCANLSNLLLARTATRQKEIAIRTALGAGRGRLIRQMLTEGVALSCCGALLGVHGTQTVYDVPVLTTWGLEELARELAAPGPVFYILTNSRSLPLPEAQALNRQIGAALALAGAQSGRAFTVVSRSDSTLRGHYPGETDALAAATGMNDAATLIIPYFREGGRFTLNDIHYVAEGGQLVPASQTPFAQDAAFGYRSSNLREWVAEKSGGRIASARVASISLDDLRVGGPSMVQEKLSALGAGQVCIVNAVDLRDLEVLVVALLDTEAATGRRFLYRSAASFVQIRAGLATRPLLTAADLGLVEQGGGLFVVGSYVPKTTAQVQALLAQPGAVAVEVAVADLLETSKRATAIRQAQSALDTALAAGKDVVLYTSRALVSGQDAVSSLAIGQQISSALVAIVAGLAVKPRFLVAKGGITSSDIATQALQVRRAMVMGQIIPGVPVWRTGAESRLPGLAYIVFPGNVGGNDALVVVHEKLQRTPPAP